MGCASAPKESSSTVTTSQPQSSQNSDSSPQSLEEACKTIFADCRHNQTIRLKRADGTLYEQVFELNTPPVQHGELVTIFPGETLYLHGSLNGDRVTNLTTASSNREPANTIVLELKQSEDDAGMTLTIHNPFGRILKYRAGLQTLEQDELLMTSICPVAAGGTASEHWPLPIFQLVLANFQLLPEAVNDMSCE